MERFVLVNALANIDFDLLTSDNIRNSRGYWGETLEIKFPDGVVFAYIDENECGFIKMYGTHKFEKIEEILITKDNFFEELKCIINKAKAMFI